MVSMMDYRSERVCISILIFSHGYTITVATALESAPEIIPSIFVLAYYTA